VSNRGNTPYRSGRVLKKTKKEQHIASHGLYAVCKSRPVGTSAKIIAPIAKFHATTAAVNLNGYNWSFQPSSIVFFAYLLHHHHVETNNLSASDAHTNIHKPDASPLNGLFCMMTQKLGLRPHA
jgi:hypothetical protein